MKVEAIKYAMNRLPGPACLKAEPVEQFTMVKPSKKKKMKEP